MVLKRPGSTGYGMGGQDPFKGREEPFNQDKNVNEGLNVNRERISKADKDRLDAENIARNINFDTLEPETEEVPRETKPLSWWLQEAKKAEDPDAFIDKYVDAIIDAGGVIPNVKEEVNRDHYKIAQGSGLTEDDTTDVPTLVKRKIAQNLLHKQQDQYTSFIEKDDKVIHALDADNADTINANFKYLYGHEATNEAEGIMDMGNRVSIFFDKSIAPTLNYNDEISRKSRQFLIDEGLVIEDPSGQLTPTPRFVNSVAIGQIATLKEATFKENKSITHMTDPETGRYGRKDEFRREKRKREDESIEGEIIEAEDIIQNIASIVFDIALENPNTVVTNLGEIVRGYGGASKRVPRDVMQVFQHMFAQSMVDQGFFTTGIDPNNPSATFISSPGATFYESVKGILPLMNIKDVGRYSTVPVRVGTPDFIKGQKKKGDESISVKGTISKYKKLVIDTTNLLNSIPVRIDKTMFAQAKTMVNQVVMLTEAEDIENDRFKLDPQMWHQEVTEDTSTGQAIQTRVNYSTHRFARTLGMDKASWNKAYLNAKKIMPDHRARDAANLVMATEARKLIKMMHRAGEMAGGNLLYYNDFFTANSVGRYFMRNTDVNPQINKLARMFVTSAFDSRIHISAPQAGILDKVSYANDTTYKNWAYIVGYHLNSYPDGVASEDKGWNNIMNPALATLSDPKDPVYQSWVKKGQALQKSFDRVNGFVIEKLPAGLADEIFEFDRNGAKGEWAYKMQAYIDVANFDYVRKYGGTFTPQARVEHDGKTNGLAIQAMQMGDVTTLKLVGMLYNDTENVIQWGTIRDKFVNNLPKNIETIFAGDLDRKAEYKRMFDNLFNLKDEKVKGDIMKLFAKAPLMEGSYGKDTGFNYDTANELISTYAAELFGENHQEVILDLDSAKVLDDLNNIIKATLDTVLDIQTQTTLKRVGKAFSIMNEIPAIRGPDNTMYHLGGRASVPRTKKGKPITFKIPMVKLGDVRGEGFVFSDVKEVDVTYKRIKNSATTPSKNTNMVRQHKTKDKAEGWVAEPSDMWGKQLENQFPVVPIQRIDASILAAALREVNDDRIRLKKPPLFVIPIHDAIITNASSVDVYHKTINAKFKEIGMTYPLFERFKEAWDKGWSNARKKLLSNKDKSNEVNDDNESWRALHRFLKDIRKSVESSPEEVQELEARIGHGKAGAGKSYVPGLTKTRMREILYYARGEGDWTDKEGAESRLTNYQIFKILEMAFSNSEGMRIEALLRMSLVERAQAAKRNKLYRFGMARLRSYAYN